MKKYIIGENDVQGYGNGVSNLFNYTDRQEAVSMLHCLMRHAADRYGAPEQETDEYGYINGMYYVDLFEIEDDSVSRDDLAEVVSWLESNFTKDGLAEVLLGGGELEVTDYYAEEDPETFVAKGTAVSCDEEGNVTHRINYEDVLKGCSLGYKYAEELFINEGGDYYTAWNLLQLVVFGELIYG